MRRFWWVGVLAAALLAAAFYWRTLSVSRRAEPSLPQASLAQLQEMARRSPNDPRIHYHLGERLQQAGQPAAAVAAFERAAALSDSEDIYIGWASAVPDAQAVTILNSFLADHPDSAAVHLALARLYQRRNDHAHSFEHAVAATRVDGRNPEAWQLKGAGALAVGSPAEAEDAYHRALALDPKDSRGYLGLGAALAQQNRGKEGLASLQRAVSLAPRDGIAWVALGQVESDAAQSATELETARQHLLKGARLRPDLAAAYLYLGQCSVKMRRWREALGHLRRAEASLPDDPAVFFTLAQVYRGLGEDAPARQALRRHKSLRDYQLERTSLLLRAGAGADPDLPLRLARLAAKHGANRTAITEYRNALAQNPGDPRIAGELAAVEGRR